VADRSVDLDRARPPASRGGSIAGPLPPAASAEVLRVEDLTVVDASGRALLTGVWLRVRRGERLLLTGPNGAGKTTLLRAAAGCVPLARGSRVTEPATRSSGGVGLLFQDPHRHLFARTVADEIAFALRRRGLSRREVEARVAEGMERCGLASQHDRSPLRLSLGEQIRTALAAVLAPHPDLLLLDEPFAGLDAAARDRLAGMLAREQAQTGAALVVATHDPRPWRAWSSRSLHLAGGRLCDA
jgi:energy-coupling factor transporter ATP-binding protein EcfA2